MKWNERLKYERQSRRWTQSMVADKIGVNRYTINRWENGAAFPQALYRKRLTALFGKDFDERDFLQDIAERDQNTPEQTPLPSDLERVREEHLTSQALLMPIAQPQLVTDGQADEREEDWAGDSFSPQSPWEAALSQSESASTFRPLKRLSWPSLLMAAMASLCSLVIVVFLIFNRLPFLNSTPATRTPGVTQTIIIDDSTQGTYTNRFNYVGTGWQHNSNNCQSNPCEYNNDNSWDNTTNDYVTVSFTGIQISFYGVLDPSHGIGAVSLDGRGHETMIDFYAANRAGNQLRWASPTLPAGTHTFKLRVTGNKNPSSSGTFVALDRVDIRLIGVFH